MKHFYNNMSRAITTDWMLKELDIAHEQIPVDLGENSQDLINLRNINPMGKVPVLVDGEHIITEVAAICAYLADKFPEKKLSPAQSSNERATYYRYMFVAGNTIEPALTLAASHIQHPNASTAGWGDIERVLKTIEILTPSDGWVLGKQFTAADIVFGGLLDSAVMFGTLVASTKVSAYIERLRARPAYIATHQV